MNDQSSFLENIFQQVLNGSIIFQNRDALRHDYIPDHLPHRKEQIMRLGEILAPSLKKSICSNVLIYGKTGTGKTAVGRFVLNKLLKKAEEINSQIRESYLNCRLARTEYRIFSHLCSSIGVKIPFTGLAVGEVFDRFKEQLDSQNIFFLITLDEIDSIVKDCGDKLLYELTRINESLTNSKVTIIGISNDLKFRDLLDPRVLSTLSEEEVVFKPYNADEIRDILLERSRIAFREGVLKESSIKLCSALAAAEHGDARRALDLLRVAAELAERNGVEYISDDHIRKAQDRIEHDRIFEALKSLPTHSKIVLLSIYLMARYDIKRSITGDIYNVYCELCEIQGISPLTQRRVSGLINEQDIMGILNSRVISLGRYGRTKKISLGIPRRPLTDMFKADERFNNMIYYRPHYLRSHSACP